MRVAILNDLSVEDYKGGTEYYNEFIARLFNDININSKNYSHKEFCILEESSQELSPLEDKFKQQMEMQDVIIMTNISNYDHNWISWLMKSKPTIKIEMDYGFCNRRNGMCQLCDDATEEMKCPDGEIDRYRYILENVDKIVFLNPHQREKYRHFFGNIVNNSIIAMSFYAYDHEFVDESRFRIPDSFLFAHRFYFEKGIDRALGMAAQNPMAKFFFVGFGNQEYIPKIMNLANCMYLGTLPDDRRDLKNYYNMFEYFISTPEWEDTGPIKVVEAELCGMKLFINDNNKIRTNGWKNIEGLRECIKESQGKLISLVNSLV